jgi:hypothetical protein
VRAREPFALEQVADQVAHLVEVAQQRLALGPALGRGRQQLGIEPRARERRAQLVAQRQQQPALGIEHGLDVVGHGVDVLGEIADVVVAPHRNRPLEVAAAEALRAVADVDQRPQQPAHVGIAQHHEQQQQAQRGPAGRARRDLPQPRRPAEDHAVAVGRGPDEPLVVPHRFVVVAHPAAARAVLAGVRVPVDGRPDDADGDRQAVDQRLRARHVGRRAELGHQPVGVVDQHRLRGLGPAGGEGLLHAREEHAGHDHREQHEHHHQPDAQRAPPAALALHLLVPLRMPLPVQLVAAAGEGMPRALAIAAFPAAEVHEEGSPRATASA